MTKSTYPFLSIPIKPGTKTNILEKIDSYLANPSEMRHVVSLNPEIMVSSVDDEDFRLILQSADVHLIDGVGMKIGGYILGMPTGDRYTGVDFMQEVLMRYKNRRLRVLLLGGGPNLADKLAQCLSETYPNSTFYGIYGSKNIKEDHDEADSSRILQALADIRPHFLFVAFGHPVQEKWIWRYRKQLQGVICVGVGGAFDFLSGALPRAPKLARAMGMEWLFRLTIQPWRWKRQLRLGIFMYYVLLQRLGLWKNLKHTKQE